MAKTNKTIQSEAAKKPTQGAAGRKATTPDSGEEKGQGGNQEERLANVAEAIDQAIDNIRDKLTTDDVKASVSDLVRLIQLRKELVEEGPKQVTVRWVEEWNNSPANEK